MDRVRSLWQRRFLRIRVVVLVVSLLLIGGSYLIMQQTDSVSVTTQVWYMRNDDLSKYQLGQVFTTVIDDRAKASRVRAIFDTARPVDVLGATGCPGVGKSQYYVYDFVFTWRGIPTESVHWSLEGCDSMQITRWGIPPYWSYFDLFPHQYSEVVTLTGIPRSPWIVAPS